LSYGLSVIPFVLARLAARVLPLALGVAVTAPPAPGPAPAPAGLAGWRLVTSFGPAGGFTEATSIAATGRDDAWATTQLCGRNCGAAPAPAGQHLFTNALTWVPGSRTDWAAGLLMPGQAGAIYRYRP
jgi:hypothetical protein